MTFCVRHRLDFFVLYVRVAQGRERLFPKHLLCESAAIIAVVSAETNDTYGFHRVAER
jgi:hypothetical protein